jgi:hypothetical protein
LLLVDRAVGMELFMELSGSERLRNRVSSNEAVERHRDVPQAFLAAVWARGRRS